MSLVASGIEFCNLSILGNRIISVRLSFVCAQGNIFNLLFSFLPSAKKQFDGIKIRTSLAQTSFLLQVLVMFKISTLIRSCLCIKELT